MRSTPSRTVEVERDRGNHMLLAITLGITLGVVGMTLIRQFLGGALREATPPVLTASEFPRLAPPTRVRTVSRRSLPLDPMRPTGSLNLGRRAA